MTWPARRPELSNFDERLSRARMGDGDTLGTLLNHFREYLFAVGQKRLDAQIRAKIGASDLVQETFLLARRYFASFRGETENELRAWLCQILANRCRDEHDRYLIAGKRAARREMPFEVCGLAVDPMDGVAIDSKTPSRHAMTREDAGRVLAGLGLLPTDWQQVVWLRNWEHRSFEDIGQQMGRSAEAVRKTFCRAVEKLGQVLRETDGEEL